MLLFEHKKDLQSYKAQSPIQKEIFYLTEITFQKLQRTTRLDIFSGICDITNIDEWDETWLSCTREGSECYQYVRDALVFPRQMSLERLQSSGFKSRSDWFDFDAMFTLKLTGGYDKGHDISRPDAEWSQSQHTLGQLTNHNTDWPS